MKKNKCSECGSELFNDNKICLNCGAPYKPKLLNPKYIILFLGIIFIIILIFDSIGVKFEEVGYFKKSTINGAYVRVYSVYVEGFEDNQDIWNKIIEYARSKEFTKGGSTTAFFFNNKTYTPDVTFSREEFDTKYEAYCIAAFWKYPNGKETFKKFPFK